MVTYRKDQLANDNYYHIFSRSIAKYVIFNNDMEFSRILELINLLRFVNFSHKMSRFKELELDKQKQIINLLQIENKTYVDIIAYCIMPTHFHLILKQNIDYGITKYMSKILDSYSKYFNIKHKRKGPLWTDRFKNVIINDDEQLLHLTRYIHLNPTSAKLIKNLKDWPYSSYKEYISPNANNICKYNQVIDIRPKEYKKFVNDRKNYQQKLSVIKNLLIDDYSG